MASSNPIEGVQLPRVAITYCTQCKWMLRAGYFGQELLSTFGTSIGEIALIPATGGKFTVYLTYEDAAAKVKNVLIWDRKAEGGFPETKILKQRVRNHIEPEKKLGHSDTPASKVAANNDQRDNNDAPVIRTNAPATEQECEECK
jgi:selT/selW/selH-like putative selenoprotein